MTYEVKEGTIVYWQSPGLSETRRLAPGWYAVVELPVGPEALGPFPSEEEAHAELASYHAAKAEFEARCREEAE